MRSNKGNGSRALWARGIIVLWAVLGLGLSARPAAAPFAYVVETFNPFGSFLFSDVSVIDTATNTVVATVGAGGLAPLE